MRDAPAPHGRRFVFKKAAKVKKTQATKDEDPFALFEHSRNALPRLREERRRRQEAAEKAAKDKLEHERTQQDQLEANTDEYASWEPSVTSEVTSEVTGEVNMGASKASPIRVSPQKRKSDSFKDLSGSKDVDDPEFSFLSKIRRTDGDEAIHASPRKALRESMAGRTAVANSEDSDDSFKSHATPTTPKSRGAGFAPSSSLVPAASKPPDEVITLDDDDDGESALQIIEPADKSPTDTTSKKSPSDQEGNSIEPEYQRFIREAEERQKRREDGSNKAKVAHILIDSKIPNTREMMAKIRVDQELALAKKSWAFTNDIGQDAVILTWKGTRLSSAATCESLRIFVDENENAYLDDKRSRGHSRHNNTAESMGIDDGVVLLEAWTEELYAEYQQQKEKEYQEQQRKREVERRQLLGKFEEEDFFGDEPPQQEKPQKKIRVTLKSKEGEAKVTVHPVTTVAELVESFRVQRKLCKESDVWISLDGDRLDEEETIESLDIEDMDTLDIIFK